MSDFVDALAGEGARYDLLHRYRPYLAYARGEGFWADAAEMVFAQIGLYDAPDRTPNVLRQQNEVLASTEPNSTSPLLSASVLRERRYQLAGREIEVEASDNLDLGGNRKGNVEEYSFGWRRSR